MTDERREYCNKAITQLELAHRILKRMVDNAKKSQLSVKDLESVEITKISTVLDYLVGASQDLSAAVHCMDESVRGEIESEMKRVTI